MSRGNEPTDNNLAKVNRPLRLQGAIDERQMHELHMRLNYLLNYHRRRKLE